MRAVDECDQELADRIAGEVERAAKDEISVEEIQDTIEKKLMASKHKNAAKSFIIYRNERTREREKKSLIVQKALERLDAKNVENSNANLDENSFSGREKEASNELQKIIALDYTMSKDVSDAHKNGLIYQHDLDKYNIGEHNCLNIDFERLFKNGFVTRNGDVRPPKRFSTACQQVAVIFQAQSQSQYGGVGTVHLDTDLAPFVKLSFYEYFTDGLKYFNNADDNDVKDALTYLREHDISIDAPIVKDDPKAAKAYAYAVDMLEREGRQSMQALIHNLNTLESRPGSQLPFSSINLGRDTTVEGRLVTKWTMEASLEGVGKHHLTSIFPISIFSYKQGVNANPEDPNYDLKQLALKSMSKRIYPNFCNGDWSEAHEDLNNKDTIFATMGKCKL